MHLCSIDIEISGYSNCPCCTMLRCNEIKEIISSHNDDQWGSVFAVKKRKSDKIELFRKLLEREIGIDKKRKISSTMYAYIIFMGQCWNIWLNPKIILKLQYLSRRLWNIHYKIMSNTTISNRTNVFS